MRHLRPCPPPRHRTPAPEERSLTEPRFLGSFPRADHPLDPPLPEIAFVGRSNVGKSTLLNALVGRRIARVSATPGKTRLLNVYQVPLGRREKGDGGDDPAPRSLYFLDLPGYGYARANRTDRAAFARLVRHVLDRPGLAGVVWLLDMRHPPSADDRAMQDRLSEREMRVLAALTKGDKVPGGRRAARAAELGAEIGLPEDQVVVTSAKTGAGIVDLREAIAELVRGPA